MQHIDPLLGPGPWPAYIEPFLGAGSVFFGLAARGRLPAACHLLDINPRLIECHQAVRDDVEGVIAALAKLPWGPEYVDRYVPMRAEFNASVQWGAEHAARFIWINKTCFNGLYRENKSGGLNAHVGLDAKGGPKVLQPPDADHLRWCSRALQQALLSVSSFDAILGVPGAPTVGCAGTRIYCDPPYVPRNVTGYDTFVSYSGDGFGPPEQWRLAVRLRELAQAGAIVVASNHDLPAVRDLYAGFDVHPLEVRRSVSRTAGGRGNVGEVLLVGAGEREWPTVPPAPVVAPKSRKRRVDVHTDDVVQEAEREDHGS